jgi:hypothetical protein
VSLRGREVRISGNGEQGSGRGPSDLYRAASARGCGARRRASASSGRPHFFLFFLFFYLVIIVAITFVLHSFSKTFVLDFFHSKMFFSNFIFLDFCSYFFLLKFSPICQSFFLLSFVLDFLFQFFSDDLFKKFA